MLTSSSFPESDFSGSSPKATKLLWCAASIAAELEVWRASAYLSFELPSALDGQPASAATVRNALDALREEIDAIKRQG